MKVLQLITSTRSFFEQQVKVLDERGVECTVLGVPGEFDATSSRSVTDYARYYPRVLRATLTGEYDLVHANYGLVAPFALAQPIRPVVLTLWGSDLQSEMRWLRLISQWGSRFANATIIPSPTMQGAVTGDHVLIPFGVDTEVFRPMPREEAREYVEWPSDRRIALFPYHPARTVKNYALAKRVIEQCTMDIELRVVVDEPYETMPYYMNASDVLMVTSHRESGPMVVREAAACNLPIVATDTGFIRETITGLRNCAVCRSEREFLTALDAILADGNRSDGRQIIDTFSLANMGDRLLALYHAVLEDDDGSLEVLGRQDVPHGA